MPHVELLWWKGCPSHPAARAQLQEAMRSAGLDPTELRVREIGSERQAQAEGFVGSPTIRIDRHDVQPPPAGEPPGLTCRIYRLRDGRVSPTPDPADVRDALQAAIEAGAPA